MSGFFRNNNNNDSRFSPARGALSPHIIRPSPEQRASLSPHIRPPTPEQSQYMLELLAEKQKIQPFLQVVPNCARLLNQEILKVSVNHGFGDFERLLRGSPSPLSTLDRFPNHGGLSGHHHERFSGPLRIAMDWQSAQGSPGPYTVKKLLRVDVPVDSFPHFNFVGRLLGPRGNSLKRVEASTGCRVFIRGRGSIKDAVKVIFSSTIDFIAELKDAVKEANLRGRPGYEHLTEPLHILIEADLPANVVDACLKQAQEIIEELLRPVDDSHDYYKKEQLRELAMLKASREGSPHPSGSVSPFSSSGMKRPKTLR